MKIKIKKVSSSKSITERIQGIGVFSVTGPDPDTGNRVSFQVTGTREEAELSAFERLGRDKQRQLTKAWQEFKLS